MKKVLLCLAVLALVCVSSAASEKVVVGHRGAAGYLPEHTLEGYAFAFALGADYVEPDLVMTRDGALICLHDIYLEPTTNVEELFPGRHRQDGHWYAADFTLAEIRELSVHERTQASGFPVFPYRFPLDASRFAVPTFTETIELVTGLNRTTNRNVGLCPELKRPSWHASEGLRIEEALLDALEAYDLLGGGAGVVVQCFEDNTLRMLRSSSRGAELHLLQAISASSSYASMWTEDGLDTIAVYADIIGPSKTIIERNPEFVAWAHARGLAVYPYTFRADDLPPGYASLEQEVTTFFFDYDVDGVFTDFPDIAAAVRDSPETY